MPMPTQDDYVRAFEDSLRADLDPEGNNSVDLSDGSDITALGSAVDAALLRLNVAVAQSAKSRDGQGATGSELDEVAWDRWKTKRKRKNAATTTVYLVRAGSTSTTIPKGSRFAAPATDTTPAVYFAANSDVATSSTKVAIPVTCTLKGTIGNIDHSEITEIVDALPDDGWALFEPTVLNAGPSGETTPAAVGGGAEDETDAELQERLDRLPQDAARRPGTKDGILFGVLETPGVRYANFVELANGTVAVYVGDANYVLSDALSQAVYDNLNSGTYSAAGVKAYRAGGIPVLVRSYTKTRVVITATLYMNQPTFRYDTADLLKRAVAAGTDYFERRPYADEYIKLRVQQALLSCSTDCQDIDLTLSPTNGNVLRQADSAYAGSSTITRYYVDGDSWRIFFSGPRTQ